MLTDNRWHFYNEKHMKGTTAGVRNWRCTKFNICKAKVHQEGNNTFIFSGQDHLCTAQPGIANTLHMKQQIKSTALQDIFTAAAEITENILDENLNSEPTSSLPALVNLARAANWH